MQNQNKKKRKERELDRLFRKILENKIIKYLKEDIAFIILSFGVGNMIYFYLINYIYKNIIGRVKSYIENIDNVSNIGDTVFYGGQYLLIGFMMVIISVLFLNKLEKTKYLILLFVFSIIFGTIGLVAVVVTENKIFLFSLLFLLSICLLIYILINVLRNIYVWLKIDKSKDKQIDVAKLTFIWGIIIFLYSLLK